jgi:hypothetical protein
MRSRFAVSVSARKRSVTSGGGIVPKTSSHARRSHVASSAGAEGETPARDHSAINRASTSAATKSTGFGGAGAAAGWTGRGRTIGATSCPHAAVAAAIAKARMRLQVCGRMTLIYSRTPKG